MGAYRRLVCMCLAFIDPFELQIVLRRVEIPALQLALVDKVAAATAAAKKPLILVVMSGGFLDLTPWKLDPRIGAMMWTGCKSSQHLLQKLMSSCAASATA